MDTFQAIAEPNRRHIVELLSKNGSLSATAIGENFSVSSAAISQHLKVLREAGVVQMHKQGQQRIYELNPEALGILENWVRRTTAEWNHRLDALDRILKAQAAGKEKE